MERKINPCLCGGDVEITKCTHTSGMDGCYENWEFNCKKCGGSWTWAADNFYGRQSYTKDDVIDIWNKTHADKENMTNGDVFKETFPDVDVQEIRGHFGNTLLGYRTWCGERSQDYLLDWWDAPYKIKTDQDAAAPNIKTVTNAKEAEAYPISENITKGFEEFTKMMFKQGPSESEG